VWQPLSLFLNYGLDYILNPMYVCLVTTGLKPDFENRSFATIGVVSTINLYTVLKTSASKVWLNEIDFFK
jgi:hypothetical protein